MMRMLTLALTGASLDTRAQSDAPPIKIGYAISRTGPFAPGAQATQEPSYILWAEQVNAAGGINVKGQRRKVELIRPPWGSTAHSAVAPLANRHRSPVLAPTAL